MSHDSLAEDLLDGVAAYAEFLGWPERRIYYMLERGQLPGGKSGNRWIGSKRRLRSHMESLTAGPEAA